jgi:thioredoxin-like negative regulator of GroEL
LSLLLKALKQAEAVKGAKPGADKPDSVNRIEGTLDLEPMAKPEAPEWVEPPSLLFGSSEAAPESTRRAPSFRWPQLSLVPLTALLAVLIALGYGIYLYLALQPPAALSPTHAKVASPAATPAAPTTPIKPVPIEPFEGGPVKPEVAALPAATSPLPEPPITTTVNAGPAKPATDASTPSTVESRRGTPSPSTALPKFQPDVPTALLSQAYAAYQRGALAEAQQLYTRAAAQVRSVDALLGLAAIASVQNREEDAQRLYREVLNLDPRNSAAQSALLDLLGNTDSQATESRLKTLIDRDPSPRLYQTLGSLYANEGRWSDAQAAYFEAYRSAPDNADYAFNLAVSLDQLHQFASALSYYEKALALKGIHRFDRTQAETRVQQLKSVQ